MEVEEASRWPAVASRKTRHVPKETVDRDEDATIILIIITSYYDYYYELQLPITVYKGGNYFVQCASGVWRRQNAGVT